MRVSNSQSGSAVGWRVLFGFLAVLVLGVGATLWNSGLRRSFLPSSTRPGTNIASVAPVTLRYVRETNKDGSLVDYPFFWVTNHTGKTLCISVRSIEVRTGLEWTPLPASTPFFCGALDFINRDGTCGELPPHAAGYGRIGSRLDVPADRVWRAQATVQEQLAGVDDVVSRIRLQKKLVEVRLSGKTNLRLNAFGKDVTTWGAVQRVTSEEVAP
jgi:hypothetical protein